MEIAPEWAEVGGGLQWTALQAVCCMYEPLVVADQKGLLAHIRALPFVIYVYAMSKRSHTHTNACTLIHIKCLMCTLTQIT